MWDKKYKKWKRRQKGNTIGRIYYAHPTSEERFYLRMLLNIVKGPTNYEDIRTFNGTIFNDFKTACMARGLLEDDNEWNDAIVEAGRWSSTKSLWEMFVTLLLFCEISNPLELWNNHWELLSDDMLYMQRKVLQNNMLTMTQCQLQNYTLYEIEKNHE